MSGPPGRNRRGKVAVVLAIAITLVACAQPSATVGQVSDTTPRAPRVQSRPLVMIVRVEPVGIAGKPPQLDAGTSPYVPRRLFNASLALIDDRAVHRPELAEALPQLNTDSWRVFPDGRMETTYRLRPNLTWHDGTPLTSEDFVLAWRIYATPEFGHANRPPMPAIDEVLAPEPRTVTIRWKVPYAGAESLSTRDQELPPLPRHLLEDAFERQATENFVTQPFWTRDYVGVGPYRVAQWEPGAFLEAVAFDNYALGRPKIDRIRLLFINDANTALANLMTGEADAGADASVAQITDALKSEWIPRTGGKLVFWPNSWRHTAIQLRPDMASPRAILDARVRKALAYTVDKDAINTASYDGDAMLSESPIWAGSEWGAATAIPGALTRYPYNPRQAERLMTEVGFQMGSDGIYVSPTNERFSGTVRTTSAADTEREMLILADTWRQAGFDIQGSVLPAAQAQDIQARSIFPTMFTSGTNMGEYSLQNFSSSVIPRPENRWNGGNRGGWVNADYDRLVDEFNRTLDRAERTQQVARMLRMLTDEVPSIPLFFRAQLLAHAPSIRGPAVAAPESTYVWNVHEWEWQ